MLLSIGVLVRQPTRAVTKSSKVKQRDMPRGNGGGASFTGGKLGGVKGFVKREWTGFQRGVFLAR